MLSEHEVSYLKTIMKSRTENWERSSTLADIYRHCKYTIRMLTRQMANIDNRRVFRKNKNGDASSHHNTHFIVYRAWVLYQARGDASKIFKLIAKLHFDDEEF